MYNVEKNLMLLTLLGTFGTDVYEGFLKALWESDHTSVVKELRGTFTHTKFGKCSLFLYLKIIFKKLFWLEIKIIW